MSSNRLPPESAPDRLLELLDKAYDAPEAPERFDDLMEAAKQYFFADENGRLAPDLPRLAGFDARLAPHIARIQKLLDRAAGPGRRTPSEPLYARLKLDPQGRVVDGNAAAAAFFSAVFPCALDELDLDFGSRKKIAGALSDKKAGQSIIRIVTESAERPAIAFCRRTGTDDDGGLEISLSHVVWSSDMTRLVGTAFALTETETDILAGFLNGLSQAEIAEQRGRSTDTIRTQAKAILRKSGCAKMSEVAQLATSVAFLLNAGGNEAAASRRPQDAHRPPSEIKLANGRRLSYCVYGARRGRPVLYVHGSLQGPFFRESFLQGLSALGATLYGPSRPGFGATSPAAGGVSYEEAAAEDATALCDFENLDGIVLLTEHGGVSHAYRAAARLGDRVRALVMVGAGIPIEESEHLATMDRYTRIAAAAVKHAPAVMEMITRIAMATYKRRGYRKFFEDYFAGSPPDLAALDDPELYEIMEKGLEHLIAQGAKTFVVDGASQMADWRADFERVNARSFWLHAADDPILPARYVDDYVTSRTNHPVEIIPEGGYNLLHLRADLVLDAIRKAFSC